MRRRRGENEHADNERDPARAGSPQVSPTANHPSLDHFFSESRISRNNETSSGGAGTGTGCSRLSLLICFTIRKMMNARMKKLIATVMKLPYANSGTPALDSASYVIGPL